MESLNPDDRWVSVREIAPLLGMTPRAVDAARCYPGRVHPPYARIGSRIRYHVATVKRWLEARTVVKPEQSEAQ